MENKINQNIAGLNLDSVNYQIKENMITFALNANIQSHDGNSTTYTNEPSNQVCVDFTSQFPGFKIVGVLFSICWPMTLTWWRVGDKTDKMVCGFARYLQN